MLSLTLPNVGSTDIKLFNPTQAIPSLPSIQGYVPQPEVAEEIVDSASEQITIPIDYKAFTKEEWLNLAERYDLNVAETSRRDVLRTNIIKELKKQGSGRVGERQSNVN